MTLCSVKTLDRFGSVINVYNVSISYISRSKMLLYNLLSSKIRACIADYVANFGS